jgi:predicted O-methyltransferase YrrM
MTGRAASADVAIASDYDFSDVRTIVDVGGGHGLMLAAILRAWPQMRGVLLDRPSVAEGARERVAAAGLADRCQVLGGDFFESVPSGSDCYVLANVIHDWDDDRAVAILQVCHAAMQPGSRILIVEAILPAGNAPHPGKIGDVQMLVITGGQERTEHQFRTLLTSSGFTPSRVVPTASPVSVVEGRR